MATEIRATIGALAAAEPALQKLTAVKLDAKARYHVVKLAKLVSAETKEHFFEPRVALFRELGISREPTDAERAQYGPDQMWDIPAARLGEFKARIEDLLSVPVTVPWGPVTAAMLEAYPEVTGADMLALGPLCVLDED